jgi:predicted dehydrogenase
MEEFEIVGLVSRKPDSREALSKELGGLPTFADFRSALAETSPNAVSINTYPDSHAEYTLAALEADAHVFLEKPIATVEEDAVRVAETVRRTGKKLVIGYILRHHPSWQRFVEEARSLGKPLVMRMNLNQQSHGRGWRTHKALMDSLSPIVDCGVHYVDVMCQMTRARPVRVHAVGARLTSEVSPDMYNYGHLQVVFDDDSVGWYEAGWGPMMSECAYFVKDVIGPKGSVSMVGHEGGSTGVDGHTRTNTLLVHSAELDTGGEFRTPDRRIDTSNEPDHQELCDREQRYFLEAIRDDLDLGEHVDAAVDSLRIVLAADRSVREGTTVALA